MIDDLDLVAAESVAILITDDDAGDRKFIRRTLMQTGIPCECVESASIDEAMAACAQRAFDGAIIDYRLPGLDGLDGVTALHQRYPRMFVVMATGQGDAVVATEAMKRGASDYISKDLITGKSLARVIVHARQKETMRRELLQQREELERFADVLVHDLKSPITSIRGFATIVNQAVRSGATEPSKIAAYCDRVVHLGDRMAALIDTLHQYTKSNAHVDFEPVDLVLVVQDAVFNLEQVIDKRGAQVSYDKLPVVFGHAALLTQLIQNLVGNGLKYCEADPPKVHISAVPVGDRYQVSVRDNGIGIAQEFVEQIFEPFKRLHDRSTYEGTGLGLATCKKIIERHGGEIWCDSTEGAGSTFYFSLPANPPGP
jgi:signal transduction histidine kinase